MRIIFEEEKGPDEHIADVDLDDDDIDVVVPVKIPILANCHYHETSNSLIPRKCY